jgi:hypothetical protein
MCQRGNCPFSNLKMLKYIGGNLLKKTAEIDTGMTEKVHLGPGRQTTKTRVGLEKYKKISQIIKVYFYLPFFLLVIIWFAWIFAC